MNIFMMFGRIRLREIPERFLRAEEWIFPEEGLIPCRFRSGYHFFEYFGISCALLSPSTRSSTVVHSLATSSAKHNLCSNYFKKTCGFYFFIPRSGWGIGLPCVTRPAGLALLRLCAAVAACQSSAPGTIFAFGKK